MACLRSYFCAFVVVLALFSGIDAMLWKTCDGKGTAKVENVNVVGCEKDPVCTMKKGKNATIAITFTTSGDATKANAVVHGIISGVSVPFPIDNPDGCKDSGLTCPLKNGQRYTYTTSIYVKAIYPSLKLVVEWELQDENAKDILCVKMPVQIVDGSKSLRGMSLRRILQKL